MTSCASKIAKEMATAAAIASTMSAPTFWSRSPSIEIDESAACEATVSFAADSGAMDTLIGAGVDSEGASDGLARTSGGLFGLLSADPSGNTVGLDKISLFEASADSTFSAPGTDVLLADTSIPGADSMVSDSFLF